MNSKSYTPSIHLIHYSVCLRLWPLIFHEYTRWFYNRIKFTVLTKLPDNQHYICYFTSVSCIHIWHYSGLLAILMATIVSHMTLTTAIHSLIKLTEARGNSSDFSLCSNLYIVWMLVGTAVGVCHLSVAYISLTQPTLANNVIFFLWVYHQQGSHPILSSCGILSCVMNPIRPLLLQALVWFGIKLLSSWWVCPPWLSLSQFLAQLL